MMKTLAILVGSGVCSLCCAVACIAIVAYLIATVLF